MKGRSILIMGLVIGLILIGYPTASQAARVLDLGDPIGGPPGEAPLRVAMEFFAAEIPKRTNGEIVISKYPPAEPGALGLLAPQRGLTAILKTKTSMQDMYSLN